MFKAILIPFCLLMLTPNIIPSSEQPLQPQESYNVQVFSNLISPGSTEGLLADITITYTLHKPGTIAVKLAQAQKPILTIINKTNQAPGSYSYVWDGKDNVGRYIEDGSYEFEIYVNDAKVKSIPIKVSSLIAKINIPKERALIRGQVPIFGTACGKDFERYIVEYAKENTPNNWIKIEESTIPEVDKTRVEDIAIGDETIYGNLTTWDTGLTNYYYYDTEVNLLGTCIIRLTVFDNKGNKAVDEVTVDVGRVISFIYGGTITSQDEKVNLIFPEHAIKKSFILFNIRKVEDKHLDTLGDKKGYRRVSDIYEIEPEGISFGRQAGLTMHYESEKIKDENHLGIYAYDPDQEIWKYMSTDRNKDDKILTVEIYSITKLYAYYAIFERIESISPPVVYNLPLETQLDVIDVYGEAEAGRKVKIYVNSDEIGEIKCDDKTGLFKFNKVPLSEGINRITGKAIDEFGNLSRYSNVITCNFMLKKPTKIYSIKLKDSDFKEDLVYPEVSSSGSLFIELMGEDADKESIDSTYVFIKSSPPENDGIKLLLLETGFHTGQYRGIVTLSDRTNATEEITITSSADPSKIITVKVKSDMSQVPSRVALLPADSILCQDTFEGNFDEWKNLDGEEGAALSLDNEATPDKNFCLKLTNSKEGGSFGAVVRDTPFSVVEYPIISFDYKIPKDAKINFLVKVGKRWYDIQFTDDDKVYRRVNMTKVGEVKNVICDNDWHSTEFNLYEMLKRYTPQRIIERMIMADYDVNGYMKLEYGRNPAGATFYIDNFVMSKQFLNVPSLGMSQVPWEIGFNDASSNEFSKKVISSYKIGDDISNFPHSMSKKNKKLNIAFNMTEEDLPKTFLLSLNFLEKIKKANLKVQINENSASCFKINSNYTNFKIPVEGYLLKTGRNTITIRCSKMREALEWDSLSFIELPTTNWDIGEDDNSNYEFLYEGDVGDDYYAGEAIEEFERAITESDPKTNIHFYLTEKDLQKSFCFTLKAKNWDVRNYDYINFDILLNNKQIESLSCPYKDGTNFDIIIENGLKKGWNVLSLEWKDGGSWISWDYLKFEPVDFHKVCSSWQIGREDFSFGEFSHEVEMGDNYFIGSDFKKFERAVSYQDPNTDIHFYLEPGMLNTDYELFIKPLDIQPKVSGVFFKVVVNDQENGVYNATIEKKPLSIAISKDILKEGQNTIRLEWVSGSDWIAWDYLKFGPVEQ